MTVRQKNKVTKWGGLVGLLVGVATLAQFAIKPMWAMENQIHANEVAIARQEEARTHEDHWLERIEKKVDELLKRTGQESR